MICPRLFLYLLSSRSWSSPKQLSSCVGCLSWLQQGGQGCTVLWILIVCLLQGTPLSTGVICFVIFSVADQTPQPLGIVSVNEVRNQIPQGVEVCRASSCDVLHLLISSSFSEAERNNSLKQNLKSFLKIFFFTFCLFCSCRNQEPHWMFHISLSPS